MTSLRQVACDYRVDGIVCLADVMHIEQHLDEERPDGTVNEAVQQVAFADRVLINKVSCNIPVLLSVAVRLIWLHGSK